MYSFVCFVAFLTNFFLFCFIFVVVVNFRVKDRLPFHCPLYGLFHRCSCQIQYGMSCYKRVQLWWPVCCQKTRVSTNFRERSTNKNTTRCSRCPPIRSARKHSSLQPHTKRRVHLTALATPFAGTLAVAWTSNKSKNHSCLGWSCGHATPSTQTLTPVFITLILYLYVTFFPQTNLVMEDVNFFLFFNLFCFFFNFILNLFWMFFFFLFFSFLYIQLYVLFMIFIRMLWRWNPNTLGIWDHSLCPKTHCGVLLYSLLVPFSPSIHAAYIVDQLTWNESYSHQETGFFFFCFCFFFCFVLFCFFFFLPAFWFFFFPLLALIEYGCLGVEPIMH